MANIFKEIFKKISYCSKNTKIRFHNAKTKVKSRSISAFKVNLLLDESNKK